MSFREAMLRSAEAHRSSVVLALDLSGPYESRVQRATKVLLATESRVAAVKLNNHLLLPFGLEGVRGLVAECKSQGIPVIADLKVNDIESTNINIVESLSDYGLDAVIANPFVGREEGLGKMVERFHARGGGVIFLVFMSHAGSKEGYGLQVGGEPVYREFARRARDWGADGVVVSAKDPAKIAETRKIVGRECLVFSPGVGAQGGDLKAGAGSGADFIIVGRSVTDAPDPAGALLGLLERR